MSHRDVKLQLSVVIPCLDESETVGVCVAKARSWMRRRGVKGEVVVADNGSRDGSRQAAAAAGARVVEVETQGYGRALMGGIQAARGRWIIMGDADDSYDFSSLDGFWRELTGGSDLVMGNRFQGGIRPRAMPPLHRYLGNPVLSWLGRIFFRSPVRDFHCGLRGFRRDAILALGLRSSGMEFASEMVVKATLAGLQVSEVPTTLDPDGRSRPPHLRTWRDGFRHLQFLLLHAPRWLFLYPGLVLLATGGLLLVLLSWGSLRLGGLVLDVHTLLYGGVFVMVGVQLLFFSLFAQRLRTTPSPVRPPWILRVLHRLLSGSWAFLVAGGLLAAGLGLSLVAVWAWGRVRFGDLDPLRVMRLVIPAGVLISLSLQVGFSAFLYEMIRLRAEVVPAGGNAGPGTTPSASPEMTPSDLVARDSGDG